MNIPVYGQYMRNLGADLAMLKVSATTIPSMRVQIAEGSALINRQLVEYAGGSVGPIALPTINSYIVVIGLKAAKPVILYGNPAANNPAMPELASDVLPLAAIILKSSDTSISQDMIQDIRPLFSSTTYIEDHSQLTGRDEADAHPMESITGLQAALDAKLTAEDLTEQFDAKADVDGTPATKFVLNSESAGTPVSDVLIEFKRGNLPSAAIRFNEEKDILEFSDGDGVWHPFNTILELDNRNDENYYTKTQVDGFINQVNKNVLLKADSTRVEALAAQIADVATTDYVNNKFLDIYSKQDMDNIVKECRLAVANINNKVNAEDVYTKTEADEIHQADKNELNGKIDVISSDIESRINPKLEEFETSIGNLDTKIDTTTENLTGTIDTKVNDAKSGFETLYNTMDRRIDGLESRINDAPAGAIAMVSEKCGQLDAKIDQFTNQFTGNVNDLTTRVEASEAGVTEAKDAASAVDARVTELTSTVEANKTAAEEALETAKFNLNADINTLSNLLDTQKTHHDEDITRLEQQQAADKTELQTNIDNAREAASNELQEQVTALTSSIDTLKTDTENAITGLKEELQGEISTVRNDYIAGDNQILQKLEEEYINVNDQLVIKANAADVYTKAEVDQKFDEFDVSDRVYTKEEVDSKLENKADIADVYRYTAAQIALAVEDKQDKLGYTAENVANKNAVNGYAGLDANGKISVNQLPDVAKQPTYVVADEAARLAIVNPTSGSKAYEINTKRSYIHDGANWILTSDADWENINIDFSNIINKPDTLAGYGIGDAYTKEEVDTKLGNKANGDHTHSPSEIQTDNEHMFISADALNSIANKANLADVYTKSAADSKFVDNVTFEQTMNSYSSTEAMTNAINDAVAPLAEKLTTYTKDDVNSLLADKANAADVYTKAEVDAMMANMYTKEEVDQAIATAIADVLTQIRAEIAALHN